MINVVNEGFYAARISALFASRLTVFTVERIFSCFCGRIPYSFSKLFMWDNITLIAIVSIDLREWGRHWLIRLLVQFNLICPN